MIAHVMQATADVKILCIESTISAGMSPPDPDASYIKLKQDLGTAQGSVPA